MRKAISSLSLCFAACAAKAPPDITVDSGVGDVDAPPLTVGLTVSGKTMDYFTGAALDSTTVATDGLDPPLTATSASDGAYSLQIATGSKLFMIASHTSYRPTRSAAVTVADIPVTQDV